MEIAWTLEESDHPALCYHLCLIWKGDVRHLGWVLWNSLFTLRVYSCGLSEASAWAFLSWTRFCVSSSMCSIGELGKIWLPSILWHLGECFPSSLFTILAKLRSHFALASRNGKRGLDNSGRVRWLGCAPHRAFCSSWQSILAGEPGASQP